MNDFAQLMAFLTVGGLLMGAIIHLAFALGVYDHALRKRRARSRVHFVGPAVWGLATLLGGVFVATAYWAMHVSNLSSDSARDGVAA